jgi:hypothetical protein
MATDIGAGHTISRHEDSDAGADARGQVDHGRLADARAILHDSSDVGRIHQVPTRSLETIVQAAEKRKLPIPVKGAEIAGRVPLATTGRWGTVSRKPVAAHVAGATDPYGSGTVGRERRLGDFPNGERHTGQGPSDTVTAYAPGRASRRREKAALRRPVHGAERPAETRREGLGDRSGEHATGHRAEFRGRRCRLRQGAAG